MKKFHSYIDDPPIDIGPIDVGDGGPPPDTPDTKPPTIDIGPFPSDVYTPWLTIWGTASDTETGVDRVEFKVDPNGDYQIATKVDAGWARWKADIDIRKIKVGNHEIRARAFDRSKDQAKSTETEPKVFKVIDNTGPYLAVSTPENGTEVLVSDGEVDIPIEFSGVASDQQTGVKQIWVTGDHGVQRVDIQGDLARWTAKVTFPGPETYTITVTATDNADPPNQTSVNLTIRIKKAVDPTDPSLVFSPLAYLANLLHPDKGFVHRQIIDATTNQQITSEDLRAIFFQPFWALTLKKTLAMESVHQVRIAIEVLRKYLESRNINISDSEELGYQQRAYLTLLNKLGTSYEEIRLARIANEETRRSLGSRLGLELKPARPDELDDLFLSTEKRTGEGLEQVSEEALERLFGLVPTKGESTGKDAVEVCTLLQWRREGLRRLWLQQDAREAVQGILEPRIDPDLIVKDDFRTSTDTDLAFGIWSKRDEQIKKRFEDLLKQLNPPATSPPPSPLERFHGAVSEVLKKQGEDEVQTIKVLEEIWADAQKGLDVGDRLRERDLSLQALAYLFRIRELLQTDHPILLDSEWKEVSSILVQVEKRKLYEQWLDEERTKHITITPEFFVIANPDSFIPLPWRSTVKARQRWQDVLKTRTEQWSTLKEALTSAVDSTGEIVLPFLRDALANASHPVKKGTELYNWLTQQLCIDLQMSGEIKTTRIAQAIETLQAILLSIKLGDFKISDPEAGDHKAKNWHIWNVVGFDREWEWVSNFAYWHAAMRVFAYPENYLLPSLLQSKLSVIALECKGEYVPQPGSPPESRWLEGNVTLATVGLRPTPGESETRWQVHEEPDDIVMFARFGERPTKKAVWLNGLVEPQGVNLVETTEDNSGTRWHAIPFGNVFQLRLAERKDIALQGNPNTGKINFPPYAVNGHLWAVHVERPEWPYATTAFARFLNFVDDSQPLNSTLAKQAVEVYLASWKWTRGTTNKAIKAVINMFELKDWTSARVEIEKLCANAGGKIYQIPQHIVEAFYFVPIHLALNLQQATNYAAALEWFKRVYAYDLPINERKIFTGLAFEEALQESFERNEAWLIGEVNPHIFAKTRKAYTRFTLMSIGRCMLEYADAEFARDTRESIGRARELYLSATDLLRLLDAPELSPPKDSSFPPNSVFRALQAHGQFNLRKLRSGRNIAGMQRQAEPELSLTDGQPEVTFLKDGGLPALPGSVPARPTPYYFSVLIQRAKDLVGLAQQMEAAYLSALEKRDAAAYDILRARQDLRLAAATVQLQELRVVQADGEITLATLQKERSETQRDTYLEWINEGLNSYENSLIDNYREANRLRSNLAEIDAAMTFTQALVTALAGGATGGAALIPAAALTLLGGQKASQVNLLNQAETAAQINSLYASHERRKQEWGLQKELAIRDVKIGEQQIGLGQQQKEIIEQEKAISEINQDHAQAMVDFLGNKFTNKDLYDWMVGVLGGVYRYFLQQATSTALLAQQQLTFERQEPAPRYIGADYWEVSTKKVVGSGDTKEPDRRGLTGSARLLQDIYRLDQFAFETNKRKLQLSQTLSLAQLVPYEFQRFRETGVLRFRTPMELFDRSFPGQYLRLIRKVRTSVVALIPPVHGIRATLAASGVSRVVTGGDTFQTVIIRRDPELVALSSPSNATGVFELDPQSNLLLPFEAMGVDTNWEFQMPKAANSFDYRTIADVLMTIEYTALHSFDYRDQVIKTLPRDVRAERPYSFREQFPDQWYTLHNPEQPESPLRVTFDTRREEFPPNVDGLRINHLLLYFSPKNGVPLKLQVERLIFKDNDTQYAGGSAVPVDGKISTRSGNAATWTPILGKRPYGMWELEFRSDDESKKIFAEEQIEDILFIVSYSGELPAWPS